MTAVALFADQPVVAEAWFFIALALLSFLASIGFFLLLLSIIGQPVVATWVWRILAGVAMCFGVLCSAWAIAHDADAGEALSVFGSTALAGGLFVLSILADLGTVSLPPQATPTPRAVEAVHSQIAFWHNVTLSLLALGTLIFVVLFVAAIQRGIFPAIESHSGGLGGGFGGWQTSPSLSYLIGAVVFGVLFSLFVLREGSSPTASMPNPVAKEDTAPKLEEKPKQKGGNDPHNGVSGPPVVTPAPNSATK